MMYVVKRGYSYVDKNSRVHPEGSTITLLDDKTQKWKLDEVDAETTATPGQLVQNSKPLPMVKKDTTPGAEPSKTSGEIKKLTPIQQKENDAMDAGEET